MSRDISVTKARSNAANISPLGATRDWMDATSGRHAYMCFPISLTNKLGWGISFPEDIVFIWDGSDDPGPEHVQILKGHDYANSSRGNGTVSFQSGLIFKTDELTTILSMPVPNQFIAGAQSFTTLISTSFYQPELPLAWKVTEANKEITIPANTPVAAILPISLTSLQDDYTLTVSEKYPDNSFWEGLRAYGEAAEAKNSVGDWSKMYRDAVNQDGEKTGTHETKSIKLNTITCPVTGAVIESTD